MMSKVLSMHPRPPPFADSCALVCQLLPCLVSRRPLQRSAPKSPADLPISLSDNTGLLLLCEVAAKPFFEQYQANYNADQDCKNAGARSTKGLGQSQPGDWQDAGAALNNPELRGCYMPKGPAVNVNDSQVYLQYNEVRVRTCAVWRWRSGS